MTTKEITMVKDYRGEEIPEPERDEIVKVWEIEPHKSNGYSSCLIMGWQHMHEELADTAVAKLEDMDGDELAEGLTIKVRLIEMPYGELLDSMEIYE